MQALIFGIRTCRRIAAQPALAPYVVDEIAPGAQFDADDRRAGRGRARRDGVSTSPLRSAPAAWKEPIAVVRLRGSRVYGVETIAGGRRVDHAVASSPATRKRSSIMIGDDTPR